MSWDLEPWEPMELEQTDADVIDVDYTRVEMLEPVDDADDVIDVQVSWLEPDVDDYPVQYEQSGDTGSDLELYEATEGDMQTARMWLDRVSEPQTKTQLATHTNTQPETRTGLWSWVTNPVKTKTHRETYGGHKRDYTASASGNAGPRWYFIAEPDPDEPEVMQHLRYWYMESEFNDGVTEWDEAAFMEWVASLSDAELTTFADAGEQIALGNWQDHVSDEASQVIDATRESKENDDPDHVGYFFNSLRNVF